MYSDTGGTDNSHPRQNLPDKKLQDKTHGQNPRELRQNLCKDLMYVCMYYEISGGYEMCYVL